MSTKHNKLIDELFDDFGTIEKSREILNETFMEIISRPIEALGELADLPPSRMFRALNRYKGMVKRLGRSVQRYDMEKINKILPKVCMRIGRSMGISPAYMKLLFRQTSKLSMMVYALAFNKGAYSFTPGGAWGMLQPLNWFILITLIVTFKVEHPDEKITVQWLKEAFKLYFYKTYILWVRKLPADETKTEKAMAAATGVWFILRIIARFASVINGLTAIRIFASSIYFMSICTIFFTVFYIGQAYQHLSTINKKEEEEPEEEEPEEE